MSENILKLENVSISFRGLKAVQNVSLSIDKNELYGLIGPNGAGKTTLFNIISGVYKPTNGNVFLLNENITGLKQMDINQKGIARTFQNIRLFNNLSVIQNVLLGMGNLSENKYSFIDTTFRTPKYYKIEKKMRDEAKEILKVFGLYELRNTIASSLPYGKQRKLEIARALATKPKLLLLDEPAAGMNPEETQELMNTIKFVRDNFDMTILLIEHDMKLVSGICDKVSVLNFGSILYQGFTQDALKDPKVVEAYLGTNERKEN